MDLRSIINDEPQPPRDAPTKSASVGSHYHDNTFHPALSRTSTSVSILQTSPYNRPTPPTPPHPVQPPTLHRSPTAGSLYGSAVQQSPQRTPSSANVGMQYPFPQRESPGSNAGILQSPHAQRDSHPELTPSQQRPSAYSHNVPPQYGYPGAAAAGSRPGSVSYNHSQHSMSPTISHARTPTLSTRESPLSASSQPPHPLYPPPTQSMQRPIPLGPPVAPHQPPTQPQREAAIPSERERSLSVSPKTKLPSRHPSMESRSNSQDYWQGVSSASPRGSQNPVNVLHHGHPNHHYNNSGTPVVPQPSSHIQGADPVRTVGVPPSPQAMSHLQGGINAHPHEQPKSTVNGNHYLSQPSRSSFDPTVLQTVNTQTNGHQTHAPHSTHLVGTPVASTPPPPQAHNIPTSHIINSTPRQSPPMAGIKRKATSHADEASPSVKKLKEEAAPSTAPPVRPQPTPAPVPTPASLPMAPQPPRPAELERPIENASQKPQVRPTNTQVAANRFNITHAELATCDEMASACGNFFYWCVPRDWPLPNGAKLEIEAKLGLLMERASNQRLSLPCLAATVLEPTFSSEAVNFKNGINRYQWDKIRDFVEASYDQEYAAKTPGTYGTKRQNKFYDCPQEFMQSLPDYILERAHLNRPPRVRVTYDPQTKVISAAIVKLRLGDCDLWFPNSELDCRISINIELDFGIQQAKYLMETAQPADHSRFTTRKSYHILTNRIDLTTIQAGPTAVSDEERKFEAEIELDSDVIYRQMDAHENQQPNFFLGFVKGFVDNIRLLVAQGTPPTKH